MNTNTAADINIEQLLLQLQDGDDKVSLGWALRAVSEALVHACARCFDNEFICRGIHESFCQADTVPVSSARTKMLMSVFSGGKAVNSAVKFAKFFLVVDGTQAAAPLQIIHYYQKFL